MKHYSASQINQYLRCSAQWKYRYIDNVVSPPSSAIVVGKSYHAALEKNYGQKIETHQDLPIDDVLDAYSTSFDSEILEIEEKVDVGELKDQGVGLVKCYQEEKAKLVQPVEVEKKIEINFDNVDYYLKGFIDLIDDDNTIHEHKTSKRSVSSISQDHKIQGIVYSFNGQNKTNFVYAVKNKTPKIVNLEYEITDNDKDFVLNLIGHVDKAIHSQTFIPNRSNFMCSRKNCGYWHLCEKEFGGKVKE